VGTGQDIVLRPANDYIASFVREVNRGRVIRAATLVRPLEENEPVPEMTLPGHLVLEKVAKRMTDASVTSVKVTNKAGRDIGVIDLSAIVQAMVTPAAAEDA
jgi:glycine betaine/proline transport system ATP-binding protein